MTLPRSLTWRRDRFFCDTITDSWYALGHDSRSARLEQVLSDVEQHRHALIALFERQGVDAPIGVTHKGHLFHTGTSALTELRHNLKPPVSLLGVSRTGHRIVLGNPSSHQGPGLIWGVEIDTGIPQPLYCSANHFLDGWREVVSPRSLRSHFMAIAIGPRQQIVLLTGKQKALEIDLDDQGHIKLGPYTAAETLRWYNFVPARSSPAPGWSLSAATFPDGSRALLDSRGLLHLQSADRTVPETTVVLADGVLGGWCADGTLWGLTYHTGQPQNTSTNQRVRDQALGAFARRLT